MEAVLARDLTLLSAQVRPVPFDVGATLAKFEDEVGSVARSFPHADVVVFPELYLAAEDPFSASEPSGYSAAVAETIPGDLTDKVAKRVAAAGRWVVAGSIFERAEGAIFNTALVFAPDGSLVGRHRKVMPWKPFEDLEAGDRTTVVDLDGKARVGILVCYDGWFPELVRATARAGAEVIVQPSLTTTPDRGQEVVLARANAITNQCFVFNTNGLGSTGGGQSVAADPEGRLLFHSGSGEEMVAETIDVDRVELIRREGTRGVSRPWQHFNEEAERLSRS